MKQIALITAICCTVLACGQKKASSGTIADGKTVYKQNCVLCHGPNGKLGANGSKDLTKSTLSMDERVSIIKNGKGAMIGLGNILTEDEIQAAAQFTFDLQK